MVPISLLEDNLDKFSREEYFHIRAIYGLLNDFDKFFKETPLVKKIYFNLEPNIDYDDGTLGVEVDSLVLLDSLGKKIDWVVDKKLRLLFSSNGLFRQVGNLDFNKLEKELYLNEISEGSFWYLVDREKLNEEDFYKNFLVSDLVNRIEKIVCYKKLEDSLGKSSEDSGRTKI